VMGHGEPADAADRTPFGQLRTIGAPVTRR
jgi:hypothetical protein